MLNYFSYIFVINHPIIRFMFFIFFIYKRYSIFYFFFFSSRRRHTRFDCDWSSDVCSSDLTSPETKRRYQLGMTDQVRQAVEQANEKAYGRKKVLRFYDVRPDAKKKEGKADRKSVV